MMMFQAVSSVPSSVPGSPSAPASNRTAMGGRGRRRRWRGSWRRARTSGSRRRTTASTSTSCSETALRLIYEFCCWETFITLLAVFDFNFEFLNVQRELQDIEILVELYCLFTRAAQMHNVEPRGQSRVLGFSVPTRLGICEPWVHPSTDS